MSSYDLLITNGNCVISSPSGELKLEKTNIGIKDGKILALGLAATAKSKKTIDAQNLTLLPGVIDSQVHFREPGLTHKEDLYTGTLSALYGGVTTVFEMPNTNPNTSSRERLLEKISLAQSKAKTHYAFFLGATNENQNNLDQISNMDGCCGVKIFMGSSTGDLLVSEDSILENIFKKTKSPISVHCEDEALLVQQKDRALRGQNARFHPFWRDVNSALSATKRIVTIAEKQRRGVHVLHVSSAEEMAFLKEKKHVATVECLPQYLTLHAPECYEIFGNYAQMNPPIRSQRHQEALWKAVESGVVDVIGSDHAPHTRAEKEKKYPASPSGLTGVQTLVPIMLDHVAKGRLSLEKMVALTSTNPARIFKAKHKGQIAVGFDADFTIVDLKKTKMITNSWIKSRCDWTVYDGKTVQGWPVMTILKGQLAIREETIQSSVIGEAVSFDRDSF